ncbi:MAG: 2-succinyl-5-enolpyruvyl-6-hydroxy-3-cyclohexene-1-carboxylic-acid synthase [Dehalococcoidia bacterium]|nr:2-succinyl-5-enolpyruvyl-6-hydroxy-3-cyclohexene-1-carboxylic-acid synthase [Dehalococcoidia bacterium]
MRHVVICPGSRSTPLTLVFARDRRWRAWLHIDERSAGYFAFGLARQLGEPVGLVCSSGTAAANFFPAVIEASLSAVPLLVLTADRPPELRDVGSPQTIDQVRMFGSHARWAVDMTPADGTPALERAARGVAARAVDTALSAPAGPVHVNFPFREPLLERPLENLTPPAGRAVAVTRSEIAPSPEAVRAFVEAARGRRGLVIAGPESGLPVVEVAAVAAALDWPVLADPLSGLRAGTHDLSHVVETHDVLTRSAVFLVDRTPEVTLRFGGVPTSKALNVWLAAHTEIDSWVVDVPGSWREPDATVNTMLRGEAGPACRALLGMLAAGDRVADAWLHGWREANEVVARALLEASAALDEPFEGRAPIELAAALPDGATLVVGNSMPVRDVDTFFPRLAKGVRLEGTRGASGIDGVVSTAAGAAAAGTGPVVLLIGDLSFLHDLNGLWAVGRHHLNLTILLVNNDGGGIFHFLPQAELAPDAFEEWWGTPHGLDLRAAVALHGGTYQRLEGASGWAREIEAALGRSGLNVLELRTERVRNVALHREVIAYATGVLAKHIEGVAGARAGAAR